MEHHIDRGHQLKQMPIFKYFHKEKIILETNELLTLREMLGKKHSNKIPESGFHVAKVLEASAEPNSRGTGSVFKLKLEITEGSDKGVIIKDSINIIHNDPYTQKKGLSWFYYFNLACGFEPGYIPSSTDEYVGKELKIQLSDKMGEAFTVTRYEPKNSSSEDSVLSKLGKLIFRRKN